MTKMTTSGTSCSHELAWPCPGGGAIRATDHTSADLRSFNKKEGPVTPRREPPVGRARDDPARPRTVAARKIARSDRACQGSIRSPRLRAMEQGTPARPPDAAVFRGSGPTRRIEVPLLASIPGLVHMITARGSDPRAAIAEASGRDLPLETLRQIHGARVHRIPRRPPAVDAAAAREEGD